MGSAGGVIVTPAPPLDGVPEFGGTVLASGVVESGVAASEVVGAGVVEPDPSVLLCGVVVDGGVVLPLLTPEGWTGAVDGPGVTGPVELLGV